MQWDKYNITITIQPVGASDVKLTTKFEGIARSDIMQPGGYAPDGITKLVEFLESSVSPF